MDKTITTALMIIAGIICSLFLFNSVYPMISRSSSAMVSMTDKIDDRMLSRIDVVHAAGSADRKTVYIWVKNVGNSQINSIEQSDVFWVLRATSCGFLMWMMPQEHIHNGHTQLKTVRTGVRTQR